MTPQNSINYLYALGNAFITTFNSIETNLLLSIGHETELYYSEISHYRPLEDIGKRIIDLYQKMNLEQPLTAEDIFSINTLTTDPILQAYIEIDVLYERSKRNIAKLADRNLPEQTLLNRIRYFRKTSGVNRLKKELPEKNLDSINEHSNSYFFN